MGVASDPYVAVECIKAEIPDVITLDIEMPRMDGMTFLEKIMTQHPIPVVICSSLTGRGSDAALWPWKRARSRSSRSRGSAPGSFSRSRGSGSATRSSPPPGPHRERPRPRLPWRLPNYRRRRAAETRIEGHDSDYREGGGRWAPQPAAPKRCASFWRRCPLDAPGIVIVQHMPEEFTARFARRLDDICRITVKEAADNDSVIRGQALIAPGNRHCC